MKKRIIYFLLLISIFMFTGCYTKKDAQREKKYEEAVKELSNKNIISSNWRFINKEYGWSYETPNYSDIYYFYIHKGNYERYKNYWLEGMEESEIKKDTNKYISDFGDHVFYAVNITNLIYINDIDYGNVHLKKDITYYLIKIYDNSLYYKYVSDYKDKDNYIVNSKYICEEENITKKYIMHEEKTNWIIEELND